MGKLHDFIVKVTGEKKEYRDFAKRIKKLPDEYEFVFEKIQHYMFSHATGTGMDIMAILVDLLEMFEVGVAEGRSVLEITGDDVAGFCDELLRGAKTYTDNQHESLNKSIQKKINNGRS